MPPLKLPKPPTQSTLRSYGLDESEWRDICRRQGWRCPVCGELLGARPLAIDHEHVAGFRAHKTRRRKGKKWKVRAMHPSDRRRHVRGVLHSFCNRFVRAWLTLERAKLILDYLTEHERRRYECS